MSDFNIPIDYMGNNMENDEDQYFQEFGDLDQ